LVDGRAGSGDFRDGRWLAFDGVDLAVALDLGEARSVSRVGVDCLQVQSAWILLPRSLSVSVSADGEDWRSLPTLTVTPEPDTTVEARLLSVDVGGGPVRYIRVVAANRAILPDWHVGAGDTGWIFVDEIVVEGA
jgi:hexosaminidase